MSPMQDDSMLHLMLFFWPFPPLETPAPQSRPRRKGGRRAVPRPPVSPRQSTGKKPAQGSARRRGMAGSRTGVR
jgi:hypothetical protein